MADFGDLPRYLLSSVDLCLWAKSWQGVIEDGRGILGIRQKL